MREWTDNAPENPPVPLIDLLTNYLMKSTALHIEQKRAMDKRFMDAVRKVDEIQDALAVRKLLSDTLGRYTFEIGDPNDA